MWQPSRRPQGITAHVRARPASKSNTTIISNHDRSQRAHRAVFRQYIDKACLVNVSESTVEKPGQRYTYLWRRSALSSFFQTPTSHQQESQSSSCSTHYFALIAQNLVCSESIPSAHRHIQFEVLETIHVAPARGYCNNLVEGNLVEVNKPLQAGAKPRLEAGCRKHIEYLVQQCASSYSRKYALEGCV